MIWKEVLKNACDTAERVLYHERIKVTGIKDESLKADLNRDVTRLDSKVSSLRNRNSFISSVIGMN